MREMSLLRMRRIIIVYFSGLANEKTCCTIISAIALPPSASNLMKVITTFKNLSTDLYSSLGAVGSFRNKATILVTFLRKS